MSGRFPSSLHLLTLLKECTMLLRNSFYRERGWGGECTMLPKGSFCRERLGGESTMLPKGSFCGARGWEDGACEIGAIVPRLPQKTNSSLPREPVLKELCVKPGIHLLMNFPQQLAECQFPRSCKSRSSGKPMGPKNPFMTLSFSLAHTPE